MTRLRLFIAVELPAAVLAALSEVQHALQRDEALTRLRWVRPEGIHLTLKFLGETPAERRPAVEAAISRAVSGIAPFEVRLGKLGSFGSRNAPRVVWIDIAGETEPLARLQAALEREFARLGFPPDNRPFSPHLTLARVQPERAREAASPLEAALARTVVPDAAFRAGELALMKSDLQRGGAVYTQLFAAKLMP